MSLQIPSLSLGVEAATLENDYFQEATSLLYGLNILGDTATAKDIQKANDLWNDFLKEEGITLEQFKEAIGANLPINERTNAQKAALTGYIEKYKDFLVEELQQVAFSEKSILTVQQTKILWSIFDILILLMNKTNSSQILENQSMQTLTDCQREYQKVINRAFLYKGEIAAQGSSPVKLDPVITHTDTNLDTYNLGYGNITMGEVVNYLLSQAKQHTGVTQTFSSARSPCSTDPNEVSTWFWNITYNANNTYSIYFKSSFFNDTKGIGYAYPYDAIDTGAQTVSADAALQTCQDWFSSSIINVRNALIAHNQASPGTVSDPSGYQVRIPWIKVGIPGDTNQQASVLFTYGGTDETLKNLFGRAIAERSARNQTMQTFISSLQTKQDILSDRSQQIQRLIESSLNSKNQTATFLLATLTQLKTLLSAITK